MIRRLKPSLKITRGNLLDNVASYSNEESGEFSINQIYGSRILVRKIEWRLPLTGPERLARFKSRILFTDLSIFADAGVAWDSSSKPVWKQTAEAADERVPFLSAGVSLRLNLFGAMVIESFDALPWRGDHFEKGRFGLNFTRGW